MNLCTWSTRCFYESPHAILPTSWGYKPRGQSSDKNMICDVCISIYHTYSMHLYIYIYIHVCSVYTCIYIYIVYIYNCILQIRTSCTYTCYFWPPQISISHRWLHVLPLLGPLALLSLWSILGHVFPTIFWARSQLHVLHSFRFTSLGPPAIHLLNQLMELVLLMAG